MTGEVFGFGGGAALAAELEVPLLAEVPLDSRLREQGDAGVPLVAADPDAPSARAILELAERVAATRREQGVGIVKQLPVVA
jgi:ATP-binding protein involved in chromosome partitioning